MAVLPVADKIKLGEFIIEASLDPALRALLRDKVAATQEVRNRNLMDIPAGDFVVFHEDEQVDTHLILPRAVEVQAAVDAVNSGESPYLDDYVPEPLANIDVLTEPMKALKFRIGEYTMGRCKT